MSGSRFNPRDRRSTIEASWRLYRDLYLPPTATPDEKRDARLSFWAGASVMFYGMMRTLEHGAETTDADLAKLEALHREVEGFSETFHDEVMRRFGGRQ